MGTATLADLRARVHASDWDGAAQLALSISPCPQESLEDYRREIESLLELARARRREMAAALARLRAANGFIRQGFVVPPGS